MSNVWKQVWTGVLTTFCIGPLTFAVTQMQNYNTFAKPVAEHEVKINGLRGDVDQIRASDVAHMDSVTRFLAEQAKQSAAAYKQTESILKLAEAQMKVIEALHKTLLERRSQP